jgi:hypothetical protein
MRESLYNTISRIGLSEAKNMLHARAHDRINARIARELLWEDREYRSLMEKLREKQCEIKRIVELA